MNEKSKTRLLTGIIVALVVLNAALLAWMYMGPKHPPHWRGGNRWKSFLADTLKFSPEQRVQFDTLRKQYFRETMPMAKDLKKARQEFYKLLDDTTLTQTQLTEKASVINNRVANMDVITLLHFRKVAALCTPAQREQLKKILIEMPFVDRGMGRGGGPPFGGWRKHEKH